MKANIVDYDAPVALDNLFGLLIALDIACDKIEFITWLDYEAYIRRML